VGQPVRKLSPVAPICPDGAESAYYVGKRPSVDSLPFWGRCFVLLILLPLQRFAYRRWGHSDVESQGIYTSRARAEGVLKGSNWFIQELPVNTCLPDETCQYGIHDFPKSAASRMYRERKFPMVARSRDEVDETKELAVELKKAALRVEARLGL
jgi:hypothetical protein